LRGDNTKQETVDFIAEKVKNKESFKTEILNYRKDGTQYWTEMFVNTVWNELGDFEGFVSIQNDITERKLKSQELKKSLDLSRKQTLRLRNFAHIVSHNFRSHAANIFELSRELNKNHDEDFKTELKVLLDKSSRDLLTSLNDLNEVLQIQENTDLKQDFLDVSTILSKVQDVLRSKIKYANATIVNQFPTDLKVYFHAAYLESILYNLLSNALKYKSPTRPLIITLAATEAEDYLEIRFSDNGLGIDLEMHGNKIFQMRKTFHDHPEARGMGLFIVRNQLEALGASIDLESAVDKGTTFKLRFQNPKK